MVTAAVGIALDKPVIVSAADTLNEIGVSRTASVGADRNVLPDGEVVPSQLVRNDKIDINNAAITDYKKFPGMFPHAAGQIASHGPYKSVDDLQLLNSANPSDKALFKKYKSELIALPPGRMFVERLNGRQSQ